MFKLHSSFEPTGDQPQAIDKLVEGINKGDKYQTLLGVNIYHGEYYSKGSKANTYIST